MKIALYFHTIRHLQFSQIVNRILFRLLKPQPDLRVAPSPRWLVGIWVEPCARVRSMVTENMFHFLNETKIVATAESWNDPATSKLWLYNLHYFDDLTSAGAENRKKWHHDLIERWIAENQAGEGNGWEPYTISLRIVNWIKWSLAGGELSADAVASLAVQVRFLCKRLEFHLLGNHLLANAKALIFAGAYFEGEEALGWLTLGRNIMRSQLLEQLLPDGGHFELSPMYHSIILEDLLDIENICRAYGVEPIATIALVDKMRRWLSIMCHPDGEISFFNDAAMGIATAPSALEAYAFRLEHADLPIASKEVHHLAESGYVRLESLDAVLLIDVARIGPDYLPGHGHADILSFELSLFGHRVLVNSGTSCYGNGADRQRQRGTAAHNTLTIDGQDSSEIWGGFRVARRANITALYLRDGPAKIVQAAHDGYRRLPGKNEHRRKWLLTSKSLTIEDEITGMFSKACAYFHLHPQIQVMQGAHTEDIILMLPEGGCIVVSVKGGVLSLVDDTWHPSFGVSKSNRCLIARMTGEKMSTEFNWRKKA